MFWDIASGILIALLIFPGSIVIFIGLTYLGELITKIFARKPRPNIYQMEFAASARKAHTVNRLIQASRDYDRR